MIVDNAIVVLDNIFHHREKGGKAQESAIKGTSQVTSAVIASTLTTLVVFFPVVFIRGMSGIMFRPLAYVVSFSLACSLFSALTLIPMLSSKFLKIHDKNTKRKTIFDGIERGKTDKLLDACLHPWNFIKRHYRNLDACHNQHGKRRFNKLYFHSVCRTMR